MRPRDWAPSRQSRCNDLPPRCLRCYTPCIVSLPRSPLAAISELSRVWRRNPHKTKLAQAFSLAARPRGMSPSLSGAGQFVRVYVHIHFSSFVCVHTHNSALARVCYTLLPHDASLSRAHSPSLSCGFMCLCTYIPPHGHHHDVCIQYVENSRSPPPSLPPSCVIYTGT